MSYYFLSSLLFRPLRWLWRLVPSVLRSRMARVRLALRDDFPMIAKPTYADDGLISQHITAFVDDSKFMSAYALGRATGALAGHPGDIHFRAYVACWAAKYALGLEGDFVECGVGKGLLSRTICEYLQFERISKKFYLLDTFEGIPIEDAGNVGEMDNMTFLNRMHFDSDYYEQVKITFAEYQNVLIVKGRVPESFDSIKLDEVSYISIDMNNAAAEIAAIEYLWDHLVFGGVVVLDDYAYGPEFLSQKDAWDGFSARKGFDVLTLPTGQGLIIKNT